MNFISMVMKMPMELRKVPTITEHNYSDPYQCYVELTVLHIIFPNILHIQSECGKYLKIFCEMLSVPRNIVMDLNNDVMKATLYMNVIFIIFLDQ